jgi:putative oxidoreductase
MATLAAIIGRLCIAALFVLAGIAKLMDPAETARFIAGSSTLPGTLAVPVGIFEITAGLLLALGFMTRLVAIVLAGFVALATVLFHYQITDPVQSQQAIKNIAIIGGLLMVFAYGQVSWRMSTWKERAARHDAELAHAKAEARADALERNRPVVVNGATPPPAERRGLFSRRRTMADRADGDPRT